MFNPVLRERINYYGRYRRSALYAVFRALDFAQMGAAEVQVATWTPSESGSMARWRQVSTTAALCTLAVSAPPNKRLDDRSRMSREAHVRFWESPGGETPPGHSTAGAKEFQSVRAVRPCAKFHIAPHLRSTPLPSGTPPGATLSVDPDAPPGHRGAQTKTSDRAPSRKRIFRISTRRTCPPPRGGARRPPTRGGVACGTELSRGAGASRRHDGTNVPARAR